jgi:thiol-disulfide isomerase/thioredoxin
MVGSINLDSVLPGGNPNQPPAKRAQKRLFGSIGLALAIVVAAWFLAGHQGFDTLGQGGVNQKLLPRAGEAAPDITVTEIVPNPGEQVSLSSLRGKTVWLNFWGSWCPPCRAEMPEIEAAYQQLAPEGVVLLAISLKEPWNDAALFAARNKVTFPIFTDQYQTDTGAAYPIYNFPTHIFIDPNGIVRHVVLSEMSVEEAVGYARDAAKAA